MAQANGHIDSYYAASAHAAPARPAAHGDIETDICIIGGGFSGVATALTLAERGRASIIVEANRTGWGASGRNGGQVLPGWSGEGEFVKQMGEDAQAFLDRTRYLGNEIIERRIERYAIECDYVHGAATVALNHKQLAKLESEFAAETAAGRQQFEFVEGAALKGHVVSDAYCGGLIDRRAAHCHPLNLCLGEARAAEALGVKIYETTRVTRIAHGDPAIVETDNGRIRAKIVVLAGNAYHRLEKEALGGYMLPAQTFTMATEPLGAGSINDVLPDNLGVCDANWALDYFRRSADDRILFGGLCTYSNRSIDDIEGALVPRLLRVFPQLEGVKTDFAWGGAIGIPLNRVPLLGAASANIFYVQGYSGHGVNCSHIAGEILADAIEGRLAGVDLFQAVRHFRIPAAEFVGNPLLALGMTWFRMRDAIGV